MRDISELKGKTLSSIKNNDDAEIIFTCHNGDIYKLYHPQDCCESVLIDDINGDLEDLVGSEIILAQEVSNDEFEKSWEESFKGEGWERKSEEHGYYPESHTWTFYKFATIKGFVDIRWFGESNGYYSESVSFIKVGEDYEY